MTRPANVSGAEIRSANDSDQEAIIDLLGGRTTPSILAWLQQRTVPSRGPGLVAEAHGAVVGYLSYIKGIHCWGRRRIVSIHPIDWVVDPAWAGRGIGQAMMCRVREFGDITISVGGSEYAQHLLPRLGFRVACRATGYTKVLHPLRYFRTRGYGLPVALVRSLRERVRRVALPATRHSGPPVTLTRWSAGVPESSAPPNTFHHLDSADHLKWLLACPILETLALVLEVEGVGAGLAVCYINHVVPSAPTARIVHLSLPTGDPAAWFGAVSALEQTLRDRDCVAISSLASYSAFESALGSARFECNPTPRCVFLHDPQRLVDDVSYWHLSYAEGDHAYRGV